MTPASGRVAARETGCATRDGGQADAERGCARTVRGQSLDGGRRQNAHNTLTAISLHCAFALTTLLPGPHQAPGARSPPFEPVLAVGRDRTDIEAHRNC